MIKIPLECIYTTHKRVIREEQFYDNTEGAWLMFRARTNTLGLGWRKRFEREDSVHCLCDVGEEETLEHFIEQCERLKEIR